jgi:hypothetical protein
MHHNTTAQARLTSWSPRPSKVAKRAGSRVSPRHGGFHSAASRNHKHPTFFPSQTAEGPGHISSDQTPGTPSY